MQDYELKNPGQHTNAGAIRKEVAHAISQLQLDKRPSPLFAAFLLDAAQKCPGYVAPPLDLDPQETVVGEGQLIDLTPTSGITALGKVTARVTSGHITRVQLPATLAAVKNGDTVLGGGSTWKINVSNGAIVSIEEVSP